MTRTDAAALLGVSEQASPDEAARRYRELHNDLQVRLSYAPTPALRKTYQRNLQELQEAVELLAPGTGALSPDLPSPTPIQGIDDLRPPAPAGRPPLASGALAQPPAQSGLPASTTRALVGCALLAALVVYLLLVLLAQASRAAQSTQMAAKLQDAQQKAQRLEQTYASLEFGEQLRIKNGSKSPVKITAATITYRDESSGTLKTVHSYNYSRGDNDFPTWDISPGATITLDSKMQRGLAWNGKVVFYSLTIEYRNLQTLLEAGAWARDIDPFEKSLILNLD
jgi:hypothetical protein